MKFNYLLECEVKYRIPGQFIYESFRFDASDDSHAEQQAKEYCDERSEVHKSTLYKGKECELLRVFEFPERYGDTSYTVALRVSFQKSFRLVGKMHDLATSDHIGRLEEMVTMFIENDFSSLAEWDFVNIQSFTGDSDDSGAEEVNINELRDLADRSSKESHTNSL